MKFKRNLLFILFLLAGIVIGSLVAYFSKNVGVLQWLAYGLDFGISSGNPMVIDLHVLTFTFGFAVSINISQILFLILSLVCYKAVANRI